MSGSLNPAFRPLVFEFQTEPTQPVEIPQSVSVGDDVKQAVRALLRHGGHKPSGRGRPASETLLKALQDGRFPIIHPVVDFFNVLSLESGLPISVLDRDCMKGEWTFQVGEVGQSYVFNPSGQVLDVKGLLLIEDQEGPTGSPVKDAQKTKISDSTRRFLVVIWGTSELPELLEEMERRVADWAGRNGIELHRR